MFTVLQDDPTLENKRKELIVTAGRALDKAKMVRFDEANGYFHSTDQGRTASHYYIKYDTVEVSLGWKIIYTICTHTCLFQ